MKHLRVLGAIVLSTLFLTSWTGSAQAIELSRQTGKLRAGSHMEVSGVVSQVRGGTIFVETPWGQMTVSAPNGLEELNIGEEATISLNANNAVIDVHRKGDSHQLHRQITEALLYATKVRAEITLSTPEGERVFPDNEASKGH